jgi:hypothetical protein
MAADPLDIIARICHEQPHGALTQIADALGYTEQREQDRAQREQTLAGLLKRCARCLPPDHATRKLATDYLRQQGYLSSPLALGVNGTPAADLRMLTPEEFAQQLYRASWPADKLLGWGALGETERESWRRVARFAAGVDLPDGAKNG